MAKRRPEPVVEELAENEEFISRDDLTIDVLAIDEEETGEPAVYVRFGGFEDEEAAEEYALFLEETLALLLFQTTKIQ